MCHSGKITLIPSHLDFLKRSVEHIVRIGDLFTADKMSTFEMNGGSH